MVAAHGKWSHVEVILRLPLKKKKNDHFVFHLRHKTLEKKFKYVVLL